MSRQKPVVGSFICSFHVLDSNPVNFVPVHAKYFCCPGAGRCTPISGTNVLGERNNNLLLATPSQPAPMPIMENQGFFRLSDPRKQKKPDVAIPISSIKVQQSHHQPTENLKPSNTRSPGVTKTSPKEKMNLSPLIKKSELPCKPTISTSPLSIPMIMGCGERTLVELKNCLNSKEIEILDLRNEKMRLEMSSEAQKKELREKAKELESARKMLNEYKEKTKLDPVSEEFNGRIQKMLQSQQETHTESLTKFKEKVIL